MYALPGVPGRFNATQQLQGSYFRLSNTPPTPQSCMVLILWVGECWLCSCFVSEGGKLSLALTELWDKFREEYPPQCSDNALRGPLWGVPKLFFNLQ